MKKELPLPIAITILLAIVAVAFIGRYLHDKNTRQEIASYEDCVSAGYPVLESYPSQCMTPDGKHFTNPDETVGEDTGKIAAGYISGKVIIGPLCPVEAYDEPCEIPAETYTSRDVIVYESDKTTIMVKEALNADGTYKVSLGPGDYFVEISPTGIGQGELKPVHVTSFETTIVDFTIDTGIR